MLFTLLPLATASVANDAAWLQWGGPRGDFTCESGKLAGKWADAGPAEVWSRDIGEGESTILFEDGVLYTMCREGERDVVIAVNADTGATVWEYKYDAPSKPGMLQDYGSGPHSTPLLLGDRLFTVGCMTHFHCFDKKTGKVLWMKDLNAELGVSPQLRGYGSSPIAYKDTVIVNIGAGRGAEDPSGLGAFNPENGEIIWKSEKFNGSYPTPIIVNVDGQEMLIDCLIYDRFALDPVDGKKLWGVKVDRQSASILASPLWIPPDKVFFSAGHGGGSRLYQIKAGEDDAWAVEELWYCNKLRIMHANAIRIGDHVYGSSGDLGPAYLMAVDLKDGKIKWRQRGFAKSTLLLADGKLIILDENGNLGLATATPEKFELHSKVKLFEKYAWAAPTLIGTRLYARDYHALKCLDLGVEANQ